MVPNNSEGAKGVLKSQLTIIFSAKYQLTTIFSANSQLTTNFG